MSFLHFSLKVNIASIRLNLTKPRFIWRIFIYDAHPKFGAANKNCLCLDSNLQSKSKSLLQYFTTKRTSRTWQIPSLLYFWTLKPILPWHTICRYPGTFAPVFPPSLLLWLVLRVTILLFWPNLLPFI